MAIDDKYGKFPIPGIPADEPVFIFRAQDLLTVPVLKHYYVLRSGVLNDVEVTRMQSTISKFIAWPKKKWPDGGNKQ